MFIYHTVNSSRNFLFCFVLFFLLTKLAWNGFGFDFWWENVAATHHMLYNAEETLEMAISPRETGAKNRDYKCPILAS